MQSQVLKHKDWLGHPRGLSVLFFTEMWERFSYYGMRALLLLFLVAQTQAGGMGLSDATGAAIYGLYVASVYLVALPGGWIADRVLGLQRSVFWGGCFIAAGHFTMAIPFTQTIYLGLVLIVIGTGLLKPNVSALVGSLYAYGDNRRDAGFSVYYSGINLGAFMGPLVCGVLGQSVNWHLGFGMAGIGMVLGLIQYRMGQKYLGEARIHVIDPEARSRLVRAGIIVVSTVAIVALLHVTGVVELTLSLAASVLMYTMVGATALYFIGILLFGNTTGEEKRHVGAIFIFFVAAVLFWSGFEQAGSTLNLFAERMTNRVLLGFEIPASVLQSVNPVFIIVLAPMFGSLWLRLGDRAPSTPAKMGLGLVGLAVGFFLLGWGSLYYTSSQGVSPMWLIGTYFFHTVGELCLSPVGLSNITKLAPKRFVGQMMGIWFMGSALGNLVAGLAAGNFSERPIAQQFNSVATTSMVAGLILLLLSPFIVRHLIGGTDNR